MRAGIAIVLIALTCSFASHSTPAFAQHHASKPKAQMPKTDAELIASAMSAAPLLSLRMPPSWLSGATANCEPYGKVRELLRAFPMIPTPLGLIRCA
jgi:hypothetical protein